MPTQYVDQFWIVDAAVPPAIGSKLTVQKYTLTDQDDDGDIGTSDTINGSQVAVAYPGEVVVVELEDGSSLEVTGTTFYLFDGSSVFTPTDGSVLEDGAFMGAKYGYTAAPLSVKELGPPCLTAGTNVNTPLGPVPVETLKPGMSVIGQQDKILNLSVVLNATYSAREMARNPRLCPVRIVAGALGNGLPEQDLIVSRQHRMLVNTPIVERMFGQNEALIAAIKLTDLPGIYVDDTLTSVSYYHLVFQQHEIIYAEGAATESLFTGPEAMRAISDEAREELFTIFPELQMQDTHSKSACLIPKDKEQKALVSRIANSDKPQFVLQA